MDCPDLELFKDVPGFTAIVKAILKSQMVHLMEQLARHGGEEAMVVTANITEGTLNHLGTTHTRGFLDDREDFKGQFLKYCIKSGDFSIVDHTGSLAPEGRESLVNLGQYTNSFQSQTEKQSNVIQHIQFQDGRAASYLSTIQPCVTAPADSHIQKRKHQDSFAGTGISAPTSTKQSCPSRTCETVPPSVSNLVNARHVPVLTFDSPAETMPVKKESLYQYNSSNYMLIHQPESLEHLTGGIEPQSNVASSSDSDMAAEYGEAVVKIEVDDGYIDTETGMVDTCDDGGSDYTGKYDQSDNTATSSSAVTHECTISDKKPSDTTSRFKSLSEEELASYEVSTTVQSRSTMKNTKWGLKLFQDWHVDIFGEPLDTNTVSTECLVEKLRKFYCEARPKESHSRASKFSASSVEMYHKNTLRNIRAAINRHLNDIGRDLDIVQDRDFKPANRALEGLVRSGLVQVTTHTEQMSDEDLRKIMLYFKDATVSPVVLRHCVIFHVAVNFSTSMDFMYMLKLDSFNFEMDDIGNEYVMLSEETQAKVLESGIVKSRSIIQKRMYGTSHADNEESCPLKMLKLLQNKTHPCAKSLFNRFVRETSLIDTWYCAKPLAKRTFAVFLQDICKQANCSRTYTAQALQFGGTWLS